MRWQLPDGQVVLIDRPFTYNDVQYPANWLRLMPPAARIAFGAIEQLEPEAPNTPYIQTAADHIRNLEATVTPRRLREAVLTPEGKAWLEDVEAQIAVLRSPL